MRILALEAYRGGASRGGGNPRGYFGDLAPSERAIAYDWLRFFRNRRIARSGRIPRWLKPIYVGLARKFALNPPTSAWGRSMAAKKGGYAVQAKYRAEGRVGPKHPAFIAARKSKYVRKAQKRQKEEAERRKSLGLPPPPRTKWNPL